MSLNNLTIKLIKYYQKNKTRSGRCKHYPTCSNYGIECYERFNFIKASFLTFFRILRCNPFSKKIYDPVPIKRKNVVDSVFCNQIIKNHEMSLKELVKFTYLYTFTLISESNNPCCSLYSTDFNINKETLEKFYNRIDILIDLVLKKKFNIRYNKKKLEKEIFIYLTSKESL